MRHTKENEEREHRITYEIVVDCYNEEERATGWHCYLEEKLKFPFKAECIKERRGSPLRKGEHVKVTGMSDVEFCSHEMFVDIEWSGRTVAVPLELLKPAKSDRKTVEAIEDWHYWKSMGYEL
jgi:hypothetical protein